MAATRQILGKVVITNKGEWNQSNVYETLDVVTYQGSSYMSKVYDNNSLPTDDAKWQLLAQKGDTYEVTESDINNIAEKITSNANSNFNKNVAEKIETFNSNAKTKTDEFNSNANTTVSAYNTNAEKKLEEYNDNDTIKLKKYNDNATSSVDNYNSNAGTKLNEYNTNSSDKLKKYNDNATKVFNNYNSNASAKLNEYNTNSDTKLKEYDDNASQKINEYNEHSKELNEKADSTRKELDRVKNEILDQGEAKGDFIHLEDSAMAELQDLSIDGVLKQKTTKGKQLYDYKDVYRKHDEFLIDENDWITVSGSNVDGNSVKYLNYYTNKSALLKPNTTYKLVLEIKNFYNKLSSSTKQTLIALCGTDNSSQYTSNKQIIFGDLQKKIYVYDISTRDNFDNTALMNRDFIAIAPDDEISLTYRISILESNEITPSNFVYEKFTGGQSSPSPDYPQEAKTITDNLKIINSNDNLFDANNIKNSNCLLENDGTILISGITSENGYCNTNVTLKELCPNLKIGQKIYFYCETDFYVNGNLKDTMFLNKSNIYLNNKYNSRIISEDDLNSNVILYGGYNKKSHIKINISYKDKKSYIQHLHSQITANLPEGEFIGKLSDTDKDTLNVKYNEKDGQYHLLLNKKISKKIFNGGPNEHWDSYTTNGLLIFRTIMGEIKSYSKRKIISNYFTNAESESITENGKINNIYHNYFNLEFSNQSCADIEAFKKWLATHNTEVYYILPEPYEIDLGIVDMPITYNEITNTFTDSDLLPQINVKYYRNFTKTIQNLQINNDTLKNELTSIENRLTALENANTTVVNAEPVVESEVAK